MAEHASNHINYFLQVDKTSLEDLGLLRNWSNVKIAFDADQIWLKDLDFAQANSSAVKSIPFKKIYSEKDGKLFPQNSLLPERNVPALLWSPIDRGLPVKLPAFNHNFFGIHQKLKMKLVASDKEQESVATLVSLKDLKNYIQTAPAVRLQNLSWTVIENSALVIGKPLLPIRGKNFWQREELLIPAGYDLELYALANELNEKINPEKNNWILCQEDASFIHIQKNQLNKLSIGSFRLTEEKIK